MKLILLVIGMVLLCSNVYADIGYAEINLIDYKTNNFIHVNSTIPLSNYTFDLLVSVNWIGIPFNTSLLDAKGLLGNISNLNMGDNVKSWNATTQTLEILTYIMPGFYIGDNFPVLANRGYEIAISTNSTLILPCLQPIKTEIKYSVFNYNNHVGTNIIRVKNI